MDKNFYDPETKQHLTERRYSVSPKLKKFCVQRSAGRALAPVSWLYQVVIMIDFLDKCRIITGN